MVPYHGKVVTVVFLSKSNTESVILMLVCVPCYCPPHSTDVTAPLVLVLDLHLLSVSDPVDHNAHQIHALLGGRTRMAVPREPRCHPATAVPPYNAMVFWVRV